MPTNDAPPLTAEEIAELRDILVWWRGIYDFKVRETPLERFDRLVAENAQIKAEVERLEQKYSEAGDEAFTIAARQSARIADLEAIIAHLMAQAERLKADGERLDFVVRRCRGVHCNYTEPYWSCDVDDSEGYSEAIHSANDLRAAIDIARKAKGEE